MAACVKLGLILHYQKYSAVAKVVALIAAGRNKQTAQNTHDYCLPARNVNEKMGLEQEIPRLKILLNASHQ